MPQDCRTAEFSFPVPDDWKDRRVIAWSAQPRPGQAVVPNILATYDRLPVDKSVEEFVDSQEADLARSAKKFTLIGRREVSLGGRLGLEILFRWDAGSGLLRQRQIYVPLDDGRLITVVNTALDRDFESVDGLFAEILAGLQWL